MIGILKALFCELVALFAPLVVLFYRGGWFNTPDDPVSPYGQYEPKMVRMYEKFGKRIGDWWWLGVRNRAMGLAYAMKPDHFKQMVCYADDVRSTDVDWYGPLRVITVDGYREYMLTFGLFHVIAGYRLRPIIDEIDRDLFNGQIHIRVRPVNMDGRPIFTIRAGARDD